MLSTGAAGVAPTSGPGGVPRSLALHTSLLQRRETGATEPLHCEGSVSSPSELWVGAGVTAEGWLAPWLGVQRSGGLATAVTTGRQRPAPPLQPSGHTTSCQALQALGLSVIWAQPGEPRDAEDRAQRPGRDAQGQCRWRRTAGTQLPTHREGDLSGPMADGGGDESCRMRLGGSRMPQGVQLV